MIEDKFYRCIPELNKECKKNNCYINGGECEMTICKKYSLKGLLEEIERLNNIINELEKWLKDYIKLFDKPDMLEEQTLEDLKEVLDKLQELKGDGK